MRSATRASPVQAEHSLYVPVSLRPNDATSTSLTRFGSAALDFVYPQSCAACGAATPGMAARAGLCPNCAEQVEAAAAAPYCGRCGRGGPLPSIHEDMCAGCRLEHHWNIRGIVRVGAYADPLRALVLGLKYGGAERNAVVMGALLARMIGACAWSGQIEALVPVPMHWKRRLQRPCSHAVLLAREVGRRLHLPVVCAARRVRYAPSQTELTARTQRFENVAGCFAAGRVAAWAARQRRALKKEHAAGRNGATPNARTIRALTDVMWGMRHSVAGRCVCIVDNLLTSGATLQEVAKAVRRAGARVVYAAVVARSEFGREGALGETATEAHMS